MLHPRVAKIMTGALASYVHAYAYKDNCGPSPEELHNEVTCMNPVRAHN